MCQPMKRYEECSFNIHDIYPAIVQHAIHFENGQRVYFTSESASYGISGTQRQNIEKLFQSLREGPTYCMLRYRLITGGPMTSGKGENKVNESMVS